MIQFKRPGLCVFESALYQTTTTVVDTADMVLVVDPNWLPDEVAEVVSYVQEIRAGRPIYLFFTHSDYDHIIGYEAFPGAKTIASSAFVENTAKDKEVQQIKAFDDKHYIQRNYGISYPKIDMVIAEDEAFLSLAETRIRFWLSPGHNGDGLFALVEPLGIWIAGDYLSDIEFPFIYHSVADYRDTLEKAAHILAQAHPKVLVPGHGSTTTDPMEMQKRIQLSHEYIDRAERHIKEEEVFDEQWLWDLYPFPIGLKSLHEDNIQLISQTIKKL